uniref:Uncharacterized protein n=1 Tax=Marseillevirus LCMAC202 TaxID=2506606 RepID=A0A481YYH6_9VIRU|nr:MAG: hypothetical protein LCMAC202_02360 [Marseillevirus LCMAC202]
METNHRKIIDNQPYHDNIIGIVICRDADILCRIYLITNKTINSASIFLGDCLLNAINYKNIHLIRKNVEPDVNVYRLDYFEEDKDLELYLAKMSFTRLEISVAFTDDIKPDDIIKFGLQYKNLEGQERRDFAAEGGLTPFKACGQVNTLSYFHGLCCTTEMTFPSLEPRENYRYTGQKGSRPDPEYDIPFVSASYYKNLYTQYDHYISPHQMM